MDWQSPSQARSVSMPAKTAKYCCLICHRQLERKQPRTTYTITKEPLNEKQQTGSTDTGKFAGHFYRSAAANGIRRAIHGQADSQEQHHSVGQGREAL